MYNHTYNPAFSFLVLKDSFWGIPCWISHFSATNLYGNIYKHFHFCQFALHVNLAETCYTWLNLGGICRSMDAWESTETCLNSVRFSSLLISSTHVSFTLFPSSHQDGADYVPYHLFPLFVQNVWLMQISELHKVAESSNLVTTIHRQKDAQRSENKNKRQNSCCESKLTDMWNKLEE